MVNILLHQQWRKAHRYRRPEMKRSRSKGLTGTTHTSTAVPSSPSSRASEAMGQPFNPHPLVPCLVGLGLALIQDESMREQVTELQGVLGYSLNDPRLLVEALTHPSHPSRPSYQRLEHVGDAVLNIVFTNILFHNYPTLDAGPLTILRSANVSTEKLARVAVRHGFYRFVRRNSADNDQLVEEFTKSVLKEDVAATAAAAFGGTAVKAPKVLADIVESIVGAVYVDAGYDSQILWRVFEPLLRPIITAETLDEQPVTKVHNLCQKLGRNIMFVDSIVRGMHVVKVVVDGVMIAESSSEHKAISKLNAAREALLHVQNSIKVHEAPAIMEPLGESDLSDGEAIDVIPPSPMIGNNVGSKSEENSATKRLKIVHNEENKSAKQFATSRVIREIYPALAGEARVGAKQELHQFCGKKHWDFPVYNREREEGPAHGKRFVASVLVKTTYGSFIMESGFKQTVKEAENQAAFGLLLKFLSMKPANDIET